MTKFVAVMVIVAESTVSKMGIEPIMTELHPRAVLNVSRENGQLMRAIFLKTVKKFADSLKDFSAAFVLEFNEVIFKMTDVMAVEMGSSLVGVFQVEVIEKKHRHSPIGRSTEVKFGKGTLRQFGEGVAKTFAQRGKPGTTRLDERPVDIEQDEPFLRTQIESGRN